MNTQKSVYNRLFSKVEKTELESQKVELAIDDYKKYLSEVEQLSKQVESEIDDLLKRFESINADRTKIRKKSVSLGNIKREAEKQVNKDIKAAKDLGIDGKVFYKEYQKVLKAESEAQKKISRLSTQMR